VAILWLVVRVRIRVRLVLEEVGAVRSGSEARGWRGI